MDRNSDTNQPSLPERKGSKLTCTLIDIIQNILNANNENKKKAVEEWLLNSANTDPISSQNPWNCMENTKRTKRRRESEPTALEHGHFFPDSESSNNADHTWEKSFLKKPRNKPSIKTEQKLPQVIKLEAAHNEETNEPEWSDRKLYKSQKEYYNYSTRPNLQKHERSHTGEKQFKCRHCDYNSANVSNLLRHVRTHTGEKPYKCGHCDYRAVQSKLIRQHESTHTGDKPYKCDHCNYNTANAGNLPRHLRIHTEERPYKCSHCDYRANQSSHLRKHERTHIKE